MSESLSKVESDLITLYTELIALDPDQRIQYESSRTEKLKACQATAHNLQTRLATMISDPVVQPPIVREGLPSNTRQESQVKAQNYFQRRPFPVFNGEKREYISFHREWKETVSTEFKEDFQL